MYIFYLFLLQYWSIWNIQAISSGINSIYCPSCQVHRVLIHFWVLFTVVLSFSISIPRVGGKKPPHCFKCSLTFWSNLPFTEPSMLLPWLPASHWQLKHSRTVALSVQQFGIQKKKKDWSFDILEEGSGEGKDFSPGRSSCQV